MIPPRDYSFQWGFLVRVVVKAAILFGLLNLLFAALDPMPFIGRVSIYNWLVPGRERLPYGESPASYNLSLNSLEALFNSHTIAQPKRPDEFGVLVIGDSSVWGVLLNNSQTLTGNLNAARLKIDNKTVHAYNIGHPVMSVTKDLLLLDYAMRYQPDMVLWLITLESLPYPKQLDAALLQNNAPRVRDLVNRYDLQIDPDDSRFVEPNFLERTLIGQRRMVADWWRLQLYGVNWAFTGIDQFYDDYEPRRNDLEADTSWQDSESPTRFQYGDLAINVLLAGHEITKDIPLLFVNEPIYIANGANSDLRYNTWYPKWAYDSYRTLVSTLAEEQNWYYLDLWDAIAPADFTDSPVHLTPNGSRQLSERIGAELLNLANIEEK